MTDEGDKQTEKQGPPRTRVTVSAEEDGLRLDQLVVRRLPNLGRRGAGRLIGAGGVRRVGAAGAARHAALVKSTPVRAGDELELGLTPELLAQANPVDAPPLPQALPDVTVVHQDEHLTVLHKPAGRATHPLAPHETDTVANHLAWTDPRCLTSGGPLREGGLCHRLDRLTSGLLVAARTAEAYAAVRARFTAHEVDKGYLALVCGAPPDQGQVDAPLASTRGRRRVTVGAGQSASSQWRVVERYGGAALVEVTTRTGRRHQVRAHLAHAGHPLVADALYGGGPMAAWSGGPLLHAHTLELPHPADGRVVRFTAALRDPQRRALDELAGR